MLYHGVPLALAEVVGDVIPVQLARVGRWEHPKHGAFEFTEDVFRQMIRNFEADVRGQELPYDVEHHPEHGAAGWFVPGSMRIEATELGPGLFVNVRLTPKGKQLVEDGEYKYSSPTYFPRWKDPETGRVYQNVIVGAALTANPYCKHLRPVQDAIYLSEFTEVGGSMPSAIADTATPEAPQEAAPEQPTVEGPAPATLSEATVELAGTEAEGMRAEQFIDGKKKPCEASEPPAEEDDGVDYLAERFAHYGNRLTEKMKGKTGSPMVRQHLSATHKLMAPLLERMKTMKEEVKMSDTPVTATEQPADIMALTERLSQMEADAKRNRTELARLRADKRQSDAVKLTEDLFPKAGASEYKLKPTQRDKVVNFLVQLSEVDESRNEALIALSESGTVADAEKSALADEFRGILADLPGKAINAERRSLNEGDAEAESNDPSVMLAEEARKLSETEKIPLHEAARRVAKQRGRR